MPSSSGDTNSQGHGQTASSKQSSSGQQKPGKKMSNYEYVKPWGGMVGFMTSYGIKPTPDGFEEARDLIEQLRAHSGE